MANQVEPGQVITVPFAANQRAVVRSVHRGGMGVVYELIPLVPWKVLALKTFQSHVSNDAFVRECTIWVSLSKHPNVATAIAFGQWRGQPAVLGPWYPVVLSHRATTKWSAASYVRTAVSILDVLAFAHDEFGVLHQDIKPGNVFVDHEGIIKVGDFGIARIGHSAAGSQAPIQWQTALGASATSGAMGGTPRYMAPELLRGVSQSSMRTDLFSFGVTLFELLTDHHPYALVDRSTDLAQQLRRTLHSMTRHLGSDIDPLLRLIEACVSFEPASRPTSFHEALKQMGKSQNGPRPDDGRAAVAALVARAQMLRQERRFSDAEQMLAQGASRCGDTHRPVLLNALGALKVVQAAAHDNDERFLNAALLFFQSARVLLKGSQGRYFDLLYAEPIINGARLLIQRGRFEKAEEMIADVVGWASQTDLCVLRKAYPEIGWFYLYRRQIAESGGALREAIDAHEPTGNSIAWLTMVQILTDECPLDEECIRKWLAVNQLRTSQDLVLALLLLNDEVRDHATILKYLRDPSVISLLKELAQSLELLPEAFADLASAECRAVCFRLLDEFVTGGRYHGNL